jgi:hypothetical protein
MELMKVLQEDQFWHSRNRVGSKKYSGGELSDSKTFKAIPEFLIAVAMV